MSVWNKVRLYFRPDASRLYLNDISMVVDVIWFWNFSDKSNLRLMQIKRDKKNLC